MSDSKEKLHDLVKEAIPNPDTGVVNFRALRDVLAATIGNADAFGIKNDSNSSSSEEHTGTEKSALSKKNHDVKELTEKLDVIADRLNVFTVDLSQKIDKLDNRVTKLEQITKLNKKDENENK